MITRKDILPVLEEMKGRLSALSDSDKKIIEEHFETVKRRPFTSTNCGDCYRDAVIEMIIYLQKNEIMQKSNYLLKNGAILQSPTDKDVYSNKNLTDEVAERYLKENTKRISFFASYPDDWEDRIKKGIKKELSPEELAAQEEAKAKFEAAEKVFIELLAGKMKEGCSKNSLKEEFKEYEIEGKKVTQRVMTDYLKKADELIEANK